MTSILDEFAEYALNLAETNIVLLVGIYKRETMKILVNRKIIEQITEVNTKHEDFLWLYL